MSVKQTFFQTFTSRSAMRSSVAVLAILCLAGCPTVSEEDERGYDDTGLVEDSGLEEALQAPQVLSISPELSAIGVADPTITITFSTAMDTASVEAAFSLAQPGSQAPAFSWEADGTQVRIDPGVTLPSGESMQAIPVRELVFDLDDTALSAEGVGLKQPVDEHMFTLARRLLLTPPSMEPFGNSNLGTFVGAGDLDNDDEVRSVITHDLSALPPATEIIEVESAVLVARAVTVAGDVGSLGVFYAHVLESADSVTDGLSAPSYGRWVFFDELDTLVEDEEIEGDLREGVDIAITRGWDRLHTRLESANAPIRNRSADLVWMSKRFMQLDVSLLIY